MERENRKKKEDKSYKELRFEDARKMKEHWKKETTNMKYKKAAISGKKILKMKTSQRASPKNKKCMFCRKNMRRTTGARGCKSLTSL